MQSGKVILAAMTMEMHRKGSNCVNEMIQHANIPLLCAFDRNVFKQKIWNDLKNDIQDSRSVVILVQVCFVFPRSIVLPHCQELDYNFVVTAVLGVMI